MHRVETSIRTGKVSDSFLTGVLQDKKKMGFNDTSEAAYLPFILIIGAADTSKMFTWSFLEAMMRFPDVQETARKHIEAVVGVDNRLPVYEDLEHIPYVRCLMKELWRWRPPVALGHPHTTMKEILYGGCRTQRALDSFSTPTQLATIPSVTRIQSVSGPKDSQGDLTTNERGKNASDVSKRDQFAFGSDRRIYPGYHVAERSLAIAIM